MAITSLDPFETVALYYDKAYSSEREKRAIEMYKTFAARFGGPVLEIGCGTGRVLLEIARMGTEIDGIDISKSMLSVLHSKLDAESLDCRIMQADMREFVMEKRYNLITIPFRSMQHMLTLEDRIDVIRSAKNHLREDGRLVFDVAFPNYEALASGFGQESLDAEWTESGRSVRMYFRRDGYCKIGQIMLGTLLFRVFDGNKILHEEKQSLEMHFFSLPELEACFMATGFSIEERYGSYNFEPLDEKASQMVFVLKATG